MKKEGQNDKNFRWYALLFYVIGRLRDHFDHHRKNRSCGRQYLCRWETHRANPATIKVKFSENAQIVTEKKFAVKLPGIGKEKK